MGRFFSARPIEFLQGTMYQSPHELMLKVIENDNNLRRAYEEQASKTEMDLLASPHLQFDKERLNQIISSYNSDIDGLVDDIYNNKDIASSGRKRVRDLQKKIYLDKTNGQLGAITGRYNAMQNFIKENEDLRKSDPSTYNMAMAYEMADLAKRVEKDPMATFTSYKVVGRPQFRKDLMDEISKLKENAIASPDGKGYIIKNKVLSEDRLMALAVSHVLGRPEYNEFARQQTKYGASGFFDQNGFSISPYKYVDENGNVVTQDVINANPGMRVRSVINNDWAFGRELNGIVGATAYQQRDIDSDSTWMGKMREAGANSRHADEMRYKWAKFEHDKANDDRNYQLKLMKLEDDDYFGGGSGGSRGGKGGKDPAGIFDATASTGIINIPVDSTQPITLAQDIKDYKKNNAARARFEIVSQAYRASKMLKHAPNGVPLAEILLNQATNNGVDISTRDGRARALYAEAQKTIKNGGGQAKWNGEFFTDPALLAKRWAGLASAAQRQVDNRYSTYRDTQQTTKAIGVGKNASSNILEQLQYGMHNDPNVQLVDQNNNVLLGEQGRVKLGEILRSGSFNIRVAPSANTNNGGAIQIMHTDPDTGIVNYYTIKDARGGDNSSIHYAIQTARNNHAPGSIQHEMLSPYMTSIMDGYNAGHRSIGLGTRNMAEIGERFGVDMSGIAGARINLDKGEVLVRSKRGKTISIPLSSMGSNDITQIGMNAAAAIASAAVDGNW